ncbi:MAG TPA: hypothetical protein VMW35_08970 [Myxococcota bacterium]|jgi:hypothetical protein|nr:hypothetical protein [Myxococcota bacterium]
MSEDPILSEYYKILDIVGQFDQRLLTVKSWGVTLSLAAIGLGFQFKTPGYFLLAAASAGAFWLIEGAMKSHQMRYYPRMREIEVLRAEISDPPSHSSPRIDWSWSLARAVLLGRLSPGPTSPTPRGASSGYRARYFAPTVLLPHAATMTLSMLLFGLACHGIVFWPVPA